MLAPTYTPVILNDGGGTDTSTWRIASLRVVSEWQVVLFFSRHARFVKHARAGVQADQQPGERFHKNGVVAPGCILGVHSGTKADCRDLTFRRRRRRRSQYLLTPSFEARCPPFAEAHRRHASAFRFNLPAVCTDSLLPRGVRFVSELSSCVCDPGEWCVFRQFRRCVTPNLVKVQSSGLAANVVVLVLPPGLFSECPRMCTIQTSFQ